MTIDTISYNGEADMLEFRLKALDEHVDLFIIVEATCFFNGHPKPLFYEEQKDRFAKWRHKIKYHVVEDKFSDEEVQIARESKYTGGDPRWMLEYLQKEALQKALIGSQDEDIVYIGDVDELWEPRPYNGIEKLKVRVYTYYLNLASTEEFWGPVRAKYKDIKDRQLNDVRNNPQYRTDDFQGWHFTNMGGLEEVRRKILANYNEDVFNQEMLANFEERYARSDYLGREFALDIDESNWPDYLKKHREEYIKWLCA